MTSSTSSQPVPDTHDESKTENIQKTKLVSLVHSAFPGLFINRSKSQIFFVLLIVTVLASIPPALVVADRWLFLLPTDVLNDIWCKSTYLCKSALPSYFLVIFICIGCLLIFMFFQRQNPLVIFENPIIPSESLPIEDRQRKVALFYIVASSCSFAIIILISLVKKQYPGWSLAFTWVAFLLGWFLLTVTKESIAEFWKSNGEFWISLLLAHGSIIAVLTGYYGQPDLFFATLIFLILAMANLWRFRHQVPLIFWIISLAMVVFTININGWWTSVVGDEYDFSELVWQMIQKSNFNEYGALLFKADGAHGSHPMLSSFVQLISVKLFGANNFGWRFSNPYLCAISIGLFYLFCKTFISKRISIIAAFLLAVSSYIMSFGKIGYNNLQSLFALTLVLAITAWALRSKLPLAFVSLGSAVAFCFYTFPGALYVVPLPYLLFSMYYPPLNRDAAKKWALTIIVILVMISPLMLQPIYWQTKVAGTLFNQPSLFQSLDVFLFHFIDNIIYSFFSFLYISSESHYIASSYLDPITSALFLIGFCLLIYQMRRQRFPLFILATFFYLFFSVGVSHDRGFPPNTRMFLLLPMYALIAAWGVEWILEKARLVITIRPRTSKVLMVVAVLVLTGVNLYQAYPLSHIRFAYTQQIESLFIRISQHVYNAEPNTSKTYAVVVDETWGIDGLLFLQRTYTHLAWATIKQVRITEPEFSESSMPLLEDRNTIVIFFPWMKPTWVPVLDKSLREIGKKPCEIITSAGSQRFVIYHDPALPQACYP